MWVCTKDGFFSVIQHRDDAARVIIRARAKSDLIKLAEYFSIPVDQVESDPHSDYRYRLGQIDSQVLREDFANYLFNQVHDIDYTSHVKEVLSDAASKNTIASATPKYRTDRYMWYLDVWDAGHKYQSLYHAALEDNDDDFDADDFDADDFDDFEDFDDFDDFEADDSDIGADDESDNAVALVQRLEDLEIVNAQLLDQLNRAVTGDPIDVELVNTLLADEQGDSQ